MPSESESVIWGEEGSSDGSRDRSGGEPVEEEEDE